MEIDAFPFRTERLLLRRFRPSDAAEIAALDNDPDVMRYVGGPGKTQAEAEATVRDFMGFPPEIGFWVAEHEGRFVGWFHLRPAYEPSAEMEIGYRFRKEAWGQGFAREGSKALLDHAWTRLNSPSVMASTDPENARSRRVMEAIGMSYVEGFLYEGQYPSVRYRILNPNR